MRRLLLATGNAHKAQEMRAILAPLLPADIQIVSLKDVAVANAPDGVEDRRTFTGNARAKAEWYAKVSGLPCIADDSGICVDALGGAPGIRSARWAGPSDHDRNLALLAELSKAGADDPARRAARFVCSCAYAEAGRPTVSALGVLPGIILPAEAGAGGFSYDPLFFLPELRMTLAEIGQDAKNQLSHRSVALRRLAKSGSITV